MTLTTLAKRTAVALGVTAAVVAGTAVEASASTIPGGNLQLCSQGNYWSFVHVLSTSIPGTSATTRSYESTLIPPGQCWMQPVDTAGQWAQVDVVGIYNNSGAQFYIGSRYYNSSASGMGIGAEGTTTSPYLWDW